MKKLLIVIIASLIASLFVSGICLADQDRRRVRSLGGLNLRDAPSTSGKAISLVPNGVDVLVIEESGSATTIQGVSGRWTKVEWGGKRGWVFGGFLGPTLTYEKAVKESENRYSYFSKLQNKKVVIDDAFLQRLSRLPGATIFRNSYFDLLDDSDASKKLAIENKDEYVIIGDFNGNGYPDVAVLGFDKLSEKKFIFIVAIFEETKEGWRERYFDLSPSKPFFFIMEYDPNQLNMSFHHNSGGGFTFYWHVSRYYTEFEGD